MPDQVSDSVTYAQTLAASSLGFVNPLGILCLGKHIIICIIDAPMQSDTAWKSAFLHLRNTLRATPYSVCYCNTFTPLLLSSSAHDAIYIVF